MQNCNESGKKFSEANTRFDTYKQKGSGLNFPVLIDGRIASSLAIIQKATYFVQELLRVPLEFDFVLYKHGPYSFDLSDELTAMRADALLKLQPQQPPYGPSFIHSSGSKLIKKRYPKTLKKYNPMVKFVANKLGDKGVTELERLATALYVTREIETDNSIEARAQCIHKLKPHVSLDEARDAVSVVDNFIEESRDV